MSATVFYDSVNELATLTNTFSVNGTPTNPTATTLIVIDPAGTSTTYTGGQLTNPGTGIFTKDIASSLEGTWRYLWEGTGAASDAQPGTWTVLDAQTGKRYCSLEELKSRIAEGTRTVHELELSLAIDSACRTIDKFCGRVFYLSTTATARIFSAATSTRARIDDFHTITDLVIKTDADGDGVFETTWTTADYQLEPLNGIVDGEAGWPFYQIRAVNGQRFTCATARAPLQVTARWGWAAPPANVKEAALILAEEAFKLADSPFGVGGYGGFGIIRVRDNPMAARLLAPYQAHPFQVA